MGKNMTIVLVILVGAGALLLLSAIENTSLQEEFQNILSGSPGGTVNTVLPPTPVKQTPGPTPGCPRGVSFPLPAGQTKCPSGYTLANNGGVIGCICSNPK